jgi:uncharacterized protein (DUF4415 family)
MKASFAGYQGVVRRNLGVGIRFDNDVRAAFHAVGSGCQTRMNAALRDWLETHSPG